ncbi:hypothetical protein FRACYDRAFT_244740 [Fragilariopsis cylindrus CCMP1102]|uniref:Apple domain-containing protein n=1 Tax=Fragilariopsis cylindrus CCMP1102 TaxID=635003 RepID=A0A1E7F092_9STRA|nr:hypothetical protein FRACYDRAFT_244740 [Fragilariopsis cylindrus CCMP1102]|eukprot:OEU11622.1 hypothetical protein FRACYDRAFT_244740 [Fragilariopsis cylindrus CCMP1102]
MSSQKGLQVVPSRFTSTKSKFRKIPTIFIVLIPAMLSLLLLYLSMKNFSVNNNNDDVIINTSMAATMATKPSLINSSKSQSQSQPKEQIIQSGATTTTATAAAAAAATTINIPSCDQSPWKLSENLIGSCPSGLKPYKSASASASATIQECATDCCNSDTCITWQYRTDVGCLHGGDIRLGMEKDGPSSWCSDIQPKRWQGQYVLKRANGQIIKTKEDTGGCDVETWNPNEQPGQCFGLGDVKMTIDETITKDGSILIKSAQDCMVACCNSKKLNGDCGAWQYHDELGCYYHKRMHGCVDASNPIVFEPFVGEGCGTEFMRHDEKEKIYCKAIK